MTLLFEITLEGGLLITPRVTLHQYVKSSYSVRWRLLRVEKERLLSLLIENPFTGYTELDNDQPHYLSAFAEAKIISLTQNKPTEIDKYLRNIIGKKNITNYQMTTFSLVFFAALGIVQLSVPTECIDSCLSDDIKKHLGLEKTNTDAKLNRYHNLIMQILSNTKHCTNTFQILKTITINDKIENKVITLTLLVLDIAIKYYNDLYSVIPINHNSFKSFLQNYPEIENNLSPILPTSYIFGLDIKWSNPNIFRFQQSKPKQKRLDKNKKRKILKHNFSEEITSNLASCTEFYSDNDSIQPYFFTGSAIEITKMILLSLAYKLEIDDHYKCIGLIYEIDQASSATCHIPGLLEINSTEGNILNSARIMSIVYFSALALVQLSVPLSHQKTLRNNQDMGKNQVKIATDNLSYILKENKYMKFIYPFLQKFKKIKISDLGLNMIRPIIFMTIIKYKDENKLDFLKINIMKSLKSIKNSIEGYTYKYPLIWDNIKAVTPNEIRNLARVNPKKTNNMYEEESSLNDIFNLGR